MSEQTENKQEIGVKTEDLPKEGNETQIKKESVSEGVKSVKSPYYIGAHVSSAGGAFNAVENASKIGASAFALFLK